MIVCCRLCRRELRTARGLSAHFTRRHRPRFANGRVSARQDQLLPQGVPG